MRRVKRMAVRVTPKAPHINWANGLEAGGVKLGSESMPAGNSYLIEDGDDLALNLEELLDRHSAANFGSYPANRLPITSGNCGRHG